MKGNRYYSSSVRSADISSISKGGRKSLAKCTAAGGVTSPSLLHKGGHMKTKLIIIVGGQPTKTVCPYCHAFNVYVKGTKCVCAYCGCTYET